MQPVSGRAGNTTEPSVATIFGIWVWSSVHHVLPPTVAMVIQGQSERMNGTNQTVSTASALEFVHDKDGSQRAYSLIYRWLTCSLNQVPPSGLETRPRHQVSSYLTLKYPRYCCAEDEIFLGDPRKKGPSGNKGVEAAGGPRTKLALMLSGSLHDKEMIHHFSPGPTWPTRIGYTFSARTLGK